MKEITLPITNTLSLTVQLNKINPEQTELVNGQKLVSLGNISNPEKFKEMDIARLNGGKVLYATSSIEKKIEQILLIYFLGPFQEHDEKRVIFENDVIQSSSFSYNFKKELVKKILNKHVLIEGKKKNTLSKYLKDMMDWRNAFAHGHIKFNEPNGCYVEYYSGEKKKLYLSDEYWNKVEETYVNSKKLLEELETSVVSLYEQ